jgi:hypothetical protein
MLVAAADGARAERNHVAFALPIEPILAELGMELVS